MERKKYLGSNIEFLMKEKGLSKSELARKSEIHFSALTNIITGITQNPEISTVIKIANALNIRINDLLYKDFRKEDN